jgi:hypothetical protein
MSAARPFRRSSLPLGGTARQRQGGHMSAARPFQRRSIPLGGTARSAKGAT